MGKIKSLKLAITTRVIWLILYLQFWLGYNLKKAFMTLFIILAAEIFLFSLIYYDLSTAVSLVTLIFVLLTFLDIPQFLEKKQVPMKELELMKVELADNEELLISFKNITPSFSNYFMAQYSILKEGNTVLDDHFLVMQRLAPEQTHDTYIDISSLDSGKYSIKLFVDNRIHSREFEMK